MAVPDSTDLFNDMANRYEKEAHFRAEVQEWLEANRWKAEPQASSQFAQGAADAYVDVFGTLDSIASMLGLENQS